MSVRLVATTAELLNEDIFRQELLNALRRVGTAVRKDVNRGIKTWDEKPVFDTKIELKRSYDFMAVAVTTTDPNYKRVDEGTKPHIIKPVRAKVLAFPANYVSKTVPNVLDSRPGGSSGPTIFASIVRHPGSEPRNFSKIIAKKHEETLVAEAEEAVARAIKKMNY